MAQPPRPSGPQKPPRPSAGAAPSQPHDRRALLEAFQDVVRSEAEKKAAGPSAPEAPPSRAPFWVVSLLLAAGLTALLLLQPPWLFTSPPPESRAMQEASLRVQMFVEIDRLERFRTQTGRAPASATEAGLGAGSDLSYEATPSGYRLTGRNGPVTLTYNSGTPPAEFLGNAYQVVRARGGQ